MRLVLLGPPSAGKGTQASMLSKRFDLLHLATGDLLREAVANGSSLGKKAKKFMDSGALVPDAIVIGLLEGKMKSTQSQTGFVLDGFPRNIDQAKQLEDFTDIDLVLCIEVDPRLLLERATGRRVCRTCGAVYHLKFNPPKAPNVCDKDGGELYLRDDDNEETVKKRLRTYDDQTKPMIQHYGSTGKLKRIEGDGSIDDVQNRLLTAIVEQWPQLKSLAFGPMPAPKPATPAPSKPAAQTQQPQAQQQAHAPQSQGGQQQGGAHRGKRRRGRHRKRFDRPGPKQQGNN
jgi:adenylate kinase